jgi:uncharacterized membrane protein YhaH (DUF805 family)
MLGYLFGFNARIGRLHYFLSSVALAVAMTVVIFALTMTAFRGIPKATHVSYDQVGWPLLTVAAIFILMTFSLQSMRFRDIGWDPVCVIPGWIALAVIDHMVAIRFPAWSIGHEHKGTTIGAVVNLGLFLALTFWPGADYEAAAPTFGTLPRTPDTPAHSQGAASPAADRIARAAGGGFGRRTV